MGVDALLRIDYQPATLSFEKFHVVDAECFPKEPIQHDGFPEFRANDFWAAYDDDLFVGFGCVVRKPDLAWLSRIGVAGAFRRRGVAWSLMETMVDHCVHIGLGDMLLYVESDNEAAIRLYERFGFTVKESACQYILSDPRRGLSADPSCCIQGVPIVEVPRSAWPSFPREFATLDQLHRPPEQYVFVFRNPEVGNLGYCRLAPGFPGCFPFVLERPGENLAAALDSLRCYLRPDKSILKLTFSSGELENACSALGLRLNYRLFTMVRSQQGGR